jgi:uncharacterized protein (TIGR02118 family)
MYCAKIIYPRQADTFFDFEHYFATHLPLALNAIRPYATVRRIEVDKGGGGLQGTDDMPYHCICSVYFDSEQGPEGFRALFASEDGKPVADDIPNYTNTTPQFQFSETVEFPVL